jgi:capsid protein
MTPLWGLFASPEEKPIIISAKNELTNARVHMNSAATLLNNAHANVQKFGRDFMNNCTQNMTMLNKSKALGKDTGDIVRNIKEEIDYVWRDLCGEQISEIENIKYGSYYHSSIYNN